MSVINLLFSDEEEDEQVEYYSSSSEEQIALNNCSSKDSNDEQVSNKRIPYSDDDDEAPLSQRMKISLAADLNGTRSPLYSLDDDDDIPIMQRMKMYSSAATSNGTKSLHVPAKTSLDAVAASTNPSKTINLEDDSVDEKFGTFEYTIVCGFKVLKRYASLYERVCMRYGPIRSTRMKMSKLALEGACSNLLELLNDMETRSMLDLDENIFQHWEVKISMLEALKLNIEWLRRCFNKVQKSYAKRSRLEKKVEQTCKAMKKVKEEQEHWKTESDELEAKLREAKGKISQAGKQIVSIKAQLARQVRVLEEEKQEQLEVQQGSVLKSFV